MCEALAIQESMYQGVGEWVNLMMYLKGWHTPYFVEQLETRFILGNLVQ